MALQKKSLLGVPITTSPRTEILHTVSKYLSDLRTPISVLRIVTPNPEQIMLAQKNEEFRNMLNDADIALPDGAGVVWAINSVQKTEDRGQKSEIPTSDFRLPTSVSRISGVDFMDDLCRVAAEKKWPVAFIGGRNGVAGEALQNLQKKYSGLTGFATDGPEIRSDEQRVASSEERETNTDSRYSRLVPRALVDEKTMQSYVFHIRQSGSKIVFVGLGAPKQEFFIQQLVTCHLSLVTPSKPLVLMAVGGAFDMFAGKIIRAPKSVQNAGFEWLWRLIQEPWRIIRQRVLLQFIWSVLREKK